MYMYMIVYVALLTMLNVSGETNNSSSVPQAQFKDVKNADLKAMDCQISELSAEVQSLTQSCRQLDAGGLSASLHCTNIFEFRSI